MKEFTITKSLYDWTVKISGKTVSVHASHVENDWGVSRETISRSMHVPFDLMSLTGIHAMLEVREQFESGNHGAIPTNNHLLTNEEREIIENWRCEYAIPYYEEDQVEIDW
ncbi:hypothetical protein [Escherichia coli]|uniref:hypothetical protein n=1 Tax=Escherichia coli TaxID=562 RepID=UPI002B30ACF0|nr:hypothetical protein VEE40_12170 [Escherichia coli]HCN6042910.1 hypothetical protein [Escherichia coli]